jgi:hypothetical protein
MHVERGKADVSSRMVLLYAYSANFITNRVYSMRIRNHEREEKLVGLVLGKVEARRLKEMGVFHRHTHSPWIRVPTRPLSRFIMNEDRSRPTFGKILASTTMRI